VKLEHLQAKDVTAKNLRDDPDLYRAVWELYCAIDLLLTNTPVFKVFYNSANTVMTRQNVPAPPMFGFPFALPGMLPPGMPGTPVRPLPAPAAAPALPAASPASPAAPAAPAGPAPAAGTAPEVSGG
jgi:hypothetical protein